MRIFFTETYNVVNCLNGFSLMAHVTSRALSQNGYRHYMYCVDFNQSMWPLKIY